MRYRKKTLKLSFFEILIVCILKAFITYERFFFKKRTPVVLCALHRGSYMSAHVLLNLLNELGKGDKMRGLPSILSLFRNEFNKFNNTRARMLDSFYRITLRLL